MSVTAFDDDEESAHVEHDASEKPIHERDDMTHEQISSGAFIHRGKVAEGVRDPTEAQPVLEVVGVSDSSIDQIVMSVDPVTQESTQLAGPEIDGELYEETGTIAPDPDDAAEGDKPKKVRLPKAKPAE